MLLLGFGFGQRFCPFRRMNPWRDKCGKIKINCVPLELPNHLPGVETGHIERILILNEIGVFPFTPEILFTLFSALW